MALAAGDRGGSWRRMGLIHLVTCGHAQGKTILIRTGSQGSQRARCGPVARAVPGVRNGGSSDGETEERQRLGEARGGDAVAAAVLRLVERFVGAAQERRGRVA